MNSFADTNALQSPQRYPMSQPDPNKLDFGPPMPVDREKVRGSPRKKVELRYDTHNLHGKLLLLKPEEFTELHSRFYDIAPSVPPSLNGGYCEPWVLLHSTLGKTWIHVGLLPEDAYMLSAFDAMEGRKEPSFVSLTDNPEVFRTVSALGYCNTEGSLALTGPAAGHVDDLIIALASHRPFHGIRELAPRRVTKQKVLDAQSVVDYPPLPVDPSLIRVIDSINAASVDPATSVDSRPNKFWIKAHFPELNDGRYMSEKHALYRHRGNEAVFPRDVWHALCYPGSFSEEKAVESRKEGKGGGERIPEAYYQVLFEDLQARERVEGTDRLKGVDLKYYDFGPKEISNLVTGGFEESETGEGDVEMADHSLDNVVSDGGG